MSNTFQIFLEKLNIGQSGQVTHDSAAGYHGLVRITHLPIRLRWDWREFGRKILPAWVRISLRYPVRVDR